MQRTLLHVAAMIGLLLMLTGTSSAYYDPVGGRFLSPDPLGHEMSMDLYSYANGDPVNFCDPDGRCGQNSMQAMSDPLTQAYVQGLMQSDSGHRGFVGEIQSNPLAEAVEELRALDRQAYLDNTIDPSERDDPLRHDPIARFSANVLRGASDALVLPALFAYPFESTSRREWLTGQPITEQEAMFHLLGVAATLPLMIVAPEARVEAGLLEGAGTRMVERGFVSQLERLSANTVETLPSKLYHYTSTGNVESIMQKGLGYGRPLVYTTPVGNLSPVQAQIELALSPNHGYPSALFEIDTARLQQLGIRPIMRRRVMSTSTAAGGGIEIIFNQPIPPSALKLVPFP